VKIWVRILVSVLACFLISASAGVSVSAEEKGSVQVEPVAGGPGFIMIGVADFRPLNPSLDWATLGDTSIISLASTTGLNFIAGVHLPQGATITKIVFYYYDASDTNIWVDLNRNNLDNGTSIETLANLPTSGNSTEVRSAETNSIIEPVVDNQSYAYSIKVTFPPNPNVTTIRLIGVRIDYGYQSDLPYIVK